MTHRFQLAAIIAVLFLAAPLAGCGSSSEADASDPVAVEAASEAAWTAALALHTDEIASLDSTSQRSAAFLAANAKRSGVKTTESGLQYLVISKGDGPLPTAEQTVRVHYDGRKIDGTVFDSSFEREESIAFPLRAVIAGWTEGVQLMPVGSRYMFFIPADLAYGPRGAGGVIGPDETLLFLVELIGIEPAQ